MTEVTDETLDRLIMESDLPVLVEFWAPWCGPCRQLQPVLEAVAGQLSGRVLVLKANTDETTLHRRFGIRAVPALLFLRGQEVLHQAFRQDLSENGVPTTRNLLEYVERVLACDSDLTTSEPPGKARSASALDGPPAGRNEGGHAPC